MPTNRKRKLRKMRPMVPAYLVHFLKHGTAEGGPGLDERFDELDLFLAQRDWEGTLRGAWNQAGPQVLQEMKTPWALGEFGPPGAEG